jgi:hypothetical protein
LASALRASAAKLSDSLETRNRTELSVGAACVEAVTGTAGRRDGVEHPVTDIWAAVAINRTRHHAGLAIIFSVEWGPESLLYRWPDHRKKP